MKKLLLAGAALALSASGVLAADVVETTQYDWSGFYIGAQAGYGWGESKHFWDFGPEETNNYTIDGFVGGGTFGYNFQIDQIVLGAEADISYADIDGSGDTSGGWGCGSGCYTEVKWYGTVRGRLGFAFDNFLPYVTGGYAFGKAGAGFEDDNDNNGTDTIDGYTVGGGLEYGVTENISLKAEYLYVDLGDFVFQKDEDWKSEAKFNVVRGGVNWRF